jgi:serine/threonine protein kinase
LLVRPFAFEETVVAAAFIPPAEKAPVPHPLPCIPDFDLLRFIKRGGFGGVYVARNKHLETLHAVKVIFPSRWVVELDAIRLYKAVVRIEDYNYLVPIDHFGQVPDGPYYYVMPLADDVGGPATLREPDQYEPLTLEAYVASRGPLPLDEVLLVAEQMVRALRILHRNGLVHCDLKPANILQLQGKWRLGDFGLMIRRAQLRKQPHPRGTHWFRAPEAEPDFNADVYALAKILFLLATDARPPRPDSTDPDPFVKFRSGELQLRQTDARKDRLRDVLLCACDDDPARRISLDEMQEALGRLLDPKRMPAAASLADPPTLGGEVAPAGQPAQIGRYNVQRMLGAGAFGVVYQAFDPALGRSLAIKVLRPEALGSERCVERFLREAKVLASLNHGNIVPVYDMGEQQGIYYIASPLVQGRVLAEAIPPNGFGAARAARIMLQLLDALAYAHDQGVLHRDVKPGNVMLNEQGTVFLMDFGLAGWVEHRSSRMTMEGAIMGTPSYMSPEQASGQIQGISPAADQYSAGVVLYELLTGHLPFEGGHVHAILLNILNNQPPRPSAWRPDLDPQLEAICLRALAKEPEKRFPDCRAFADALRLWLTMQAASVPSDRLDGDPPKDSPLSEIERTLNSYDGAELPASGPNADSSAEVVSLPSSVLSMSAASDPNATDSPAPGNGAIVDGTTLNEPPTQRTLPLPSAPPGPSDQQDSKTASGRAWRLPVGSAIQEAARLLKELQRTVAGYFD